ncbi:MAG: radical SAM protein [Bacteroidota bacterium]|nr:radical SAM protein [Bacteroidota bacterium]
MLTFDEIERAAKLFAAMGVNKIRLTGGEPLVRKDLPKLIKRLASISGIQTLGMTTNGVLLKSFAPELKRVVLTNINVSLDSLRPSRFELISGRQYLKDVTDGIYASLDAGFQPLKMNVVVRGVSTMMNYSTSLSLLKINQSMFVSSSTCLLGEEE